MAEFMTNSDAFTWAMESDPRLRSTIVTVVLLERSPDWAAVRELFERMSRTLPMFRQRVRASPVPAPPRWEDDPNFDLDYHLRRVRAGPPGTVDTVWAMAGLAQMQDFDRARALWEATLIDGLTDGKADGKAALLCRFHHALTDGVGGVEIAMNLFDVAEQPRQRDQLPPAPDVVEPSRFSHYRHAWGYGAGMLGGAVTATATRSPGLLYRGVRQPVAALRSAAAAAASVYRTVRPLNRPGSALMTERSINRRVGVHHVALPDLRAAARRGGGTLNDAFVAGVLGGLRRYHEKHGVAIAELHLNMPINLRTDADPAGGNRVTLMRFDVPAGVVDPAQRIRQIHQRTEAIRREPSLAYTQAIAGALNLMPRWYIGSVLRNVDVIASNVPGFPVPVFLGGAPVHSHYAFSPTLGAALNVTLLSYVDTCALGINVDTAAIPDFEVFHHAFVAGFDEVLAVAG